MGDEDLCRGVMTEGADRQAGWLWGVVGGKGERYGWADSITVRCPSILFTRPRRMCITIALRLTVTQIDKTHCIRLVHRIHDIIMFIGQNG